MFVNGSVKPNKLGTDPKNTSRSDTSAKGQVSVSVPNIDKSQSEFTRYRKRITI